MAFAVNQLLPGLIGVSLLYVYHPNALLRIVVRSKYINSITIVRLYILSFKY